MKKTLLFGLMVLASGGVMSCSEEDNFDNNQHIYHPGDKIVFNADAAVKAGNEAAKTGRTAYGDISDGKIALNWVVNDSIDIAYKVANSNETAIATYQIPEGNKPVATSLVSQNGLEWKGTEVHNFYAIYPSAKVFDKYSLEEKPSFELDINNTIAKGFMPKSYTVRDTAITVTEEGSKHIYTIAPNMDFAYMVAKNSMRLAESNQKGGISLSFAPLATALEFEIIASEIGVDDKDTITLNRVEFIAKQNITGHFTYDFSNETLTNTSSQEREKDLGIVPLRNRLSFDIDAVEYKKNIKLTKDDICRISAFIIPDHDINPSTMQVKIWYSHGIFPESKTAVLKNDIKIKHKYCFKNFKLPAINKSSTPLIDGWFYIKHCATDQYIAPGSKETPVTIKLTKDKDNDAKWYIHSDVKQGKSSFLIGGVTQWGGKYYWTVNRGLFDATKNQCYIRGLAATGDTYDYFKLYASKDDPGAENKYEIMYDHSIANSHDEKELIFKTKCVKFFKDDEQHPFGLGLRGDAANVVILEATDAPQPPKNEW